MSEEFRGARVLITGGAGFIGSTLAIRLVQLGAQVTVLDSLIPEYGGNLFNLQPVSQQVRVHITDVRNQHGLQHLVRDQDYLFNLAGQTSHMDSMTDPQTDLEINCRAQLSLLEVCRAVNNRLRLVYASTRQIYGKPDRLPVPETHPLRPVDVNGINKLAGEFYHLLYSDVYGIPATVLRLTNTYGPRMRIRDARQTFVGVWIRCLLEGQPFDVW
ncbi:MAG: NAD-dependent epimerase/dehydratase family protein, partial [Planctomycetaceae bacterium]